MKRDLFMADFSFGAVCGRYFSKKQYAAIRAATIGIAGAGGLGSNCAMHLVRSGFEKFIIADFDVVELSNLNRQAYIPQHVGRPKVNCLQELLQQINPGCSVEKHLIKVDASNAPGFFGPCDVVVEAFDTPECKAMIVNAFVDTGKLVVSASGLGGFGNSDRIVTRKVRDNFYCIGDGESGVDENMPPLAPCVGIAAAKQADVVLEWVLAGGKVPAARFNED
jgi:sulfur carrier protein ThiS adenylyltransferase